MRQKWRKQTTVQAQWNIRLETVPPPALRDLKSVVLHQEGYFNEEPNSLKRLGGPPKFFH